MKSKEDNWLVWLETNMPDYYRKCKDYAMSCIEQVAKDLNIQQYNHPDNSKQDIYKEMLTFVRIAIAPKRPDETVELFCTLMTDNMIEKFLMNYVDEQFQNL